MTTVTMTEARVAGQSGLVAADVPDPQVQERAVRRTYSAKYKRDVLAEYEACDRAGKGALLRREGLYTSLISAWRAQRDAGALEALGRPSGAAPADPAVAEAARLPAGAAPDQPARPMLKWTYYHLYVILDIFSSLRRGLDGRHAGKRAPLAEALDPPDRHQAAGTDRGSARPSMLTAVSSMQP